MRPWGQEPQSRGLAVEAWTHWGPWRQEPWGMGPWGPWVERGKGGASGAGGAGGRALGPFKVF